MPHRPPEKLPVSHGRIDDLRTPADHPGRDLPVGPKVIRPVQPDVVHPPRMGNLWIKRC
jgi:hypothetical protein